MMKTVIIIQARMTSTRLPGKVMKKVLGKALLDYQIERLQRCREAEAMMLATPTDPINQPIWETASRLKVGLFKGDEDDVLARYHGAAKASQADVVVRVTSDCPLIDPAVVDGVIHYFKQNAEKLDYVSNTLQRTYPRGMDTEVFHFRDLDQAFHEAKKPSEREHVTPFIYGHPERFRLANVAYSTDESRHRWTVDTPEDFELIRRLIEALHPANGRFDLADLLAMIREHPDWEHLNRDIAQKSPV